MPYFTSLYVLRICSFVNRDCWSSTFELELAVPATRTYNPPSVVGRLKTNLAFDFPLDKKFSPRLVQFGRILRPVPYGVVGPAPWAQTL
jgi:hypothetical protein